jgi:dihydrofolate reductase
MSKNRVIGQGASIPWHIPGEQKRFREITSGHSIILGRRTYEAIGRPLPERTNIVVTRQRDYQAPGCIVVHDLQQALKACPEGEDEAFICGGGELYAQAVSYADRIYLTVLQREVSGNVYFPDFSTQEFELVHSESVKDSSEPYSFKIYERNR